MLEAKLHLVETTEEVDQFRTWLGERRPVLAVDTETGGLDWWREPLRTVQFGDVNSGWVIPAELWLGLARETLQRYTGELVFQNAPFDWLVLEHNNVPVPRERCHDTKVEHHLVDPAAFHSLKQMAVELVDPSADDGQQQLKTAMAKHRWTWATIPWDFPTYWHYAGLDAVLTARVHEKLAPLVESSYRELYDLELVVQSITADMAKRGVALDMEYVYDLGSRYEAREEELHEQIRELYHVANPSSNAQVISRLLRDGVKLTKRTERGNNVALDEEVLVSLSHPLATLVLELRKVEKMRGTYLDNFVDLNDHGILHTNVNTLGARTGRMSMTRPALQTLPRGSAIRDAFVPRAEENSLLLIDYDQIEMRVLASFAQEQAMIDIINSGEDIHLMMAKEIYQTDDIPRERRQITKNANFAKAYVAGITKFALTAGIPYEQAESFMNAYDQRFPGIRDFQDRVVETIYERGVDGNDGWVISPIGRRHPVDVQVAYKAVNYLIQGTAADVFKTTLYALAAAGLDRYLVLTVHDEDAFDVPTAEVEEFRREAEKVLTVPMNTPPWNFPVPLTVSSEIVQRWGDKYRDDH